MSDSQNHILDAAQQQAWEALWRRLLLPGDVSSSPDDQKEPPTEPGACVNPLEDVNQANEGDQ